MPFATTKKKTKKHDWRAVAEETEAETPENGEGGETGAVSEEFQKLQSELDERDRLARLKVEELEARVKEMQELRDAPQTDESAEQQEAGKLCDGQAAYLVDGAEPQEEPTCVSVSNMNYKTRLHEIKQHFHQFGDVVEICMGGKAAFITFDRSKDALEAERDGDGSLLMGRRISVVRKLSKEKPRSGVRWHRDDALRKKESMRNEHEWRENAAAERRDRDRERRRAQNQYEKERARRIKAREQERQEREQRRRSRSRSRDGRGADDNSRRRDRSRSRDRSGRDNRDNHSGR